MRVLGEGGPGVEDPGAPLGTGDHRRCRGALPRSVDLLDRRRAAAHEDLEDLYLDRMDEARNDRAITRLEARLDRARARLDENYDRRRDRLEERLERDES